MKFHLALLSATIAATLLTSPAWAGNDRDTAKPTTTSEPKEDKRSPEQKMREQEKDKDDAKTVPQTKPAAGGAGYVQTGKTIHYPGDKFVLKAVVPKSLKDVWAGKATVHMVITMPGELGALSVPVPTPASEQATQGDKPRQVIELPPQTMETLPAGDYQMAMIVTKVGGDPLNVKDWYGGLKAMLGVKRVKIAATPIDPEDPNQTGNVTGDSDGDGYPDTDPTMPPPPSVGDHVQPCLLPEGCTKPSTGGNTTTGGTTPPSSPTGGTTDVIPQGIRG